MRLKHYLVALLCLCVLPTYVFQPLSIVSAQDGGDYSDSDEIPFECDNNSLPEGLCAELSEKFAPDGLWKIENQEALTCITKSCSPGLKAVFSACTSVGFGQRCQGVEISDNDPQVWSSNIKAEPEDGLSHSEHQKHLVVRALGFSKMVGYLAKEAIHNSNKDFDQARDVYADESLKRQIEEAKQQKDYYDNINFREVSRKAVCDDPIYKGDVKTYLDHEFHMNKNYVTAINVAGNGFGEILDGGSNPKKVFSKGAINDRGRLRSGKLCRGDSEAFTIPSDELLETVMVQTEEIRSQGFINEVGNVTEEGNSALKLADDFEDNLGVQCKIEENGIGHIFRAVAENNRFMNTASKASYCGDLGRKGCSLPKLESIDESCKTSHEESMDAYLSEYMDGPQFDKDQYIDPTTGRLKTNTKQLLLEQLTIDKEKQYAEANSNSEDLADVIEFKARFSAIMDLLKAEIGNNGWFFKPDQTILTSKGAVKIDEEDIAIIKELPPKGDVNEKLEGSKSAPNNNGNYGGRGAPSDRYQPDTDASDRPLMKDRLAGLPKHASNLDGAQDYEGINADTDNSFSGSGNARQSKSSKEDLVTNNPIYIDNTDRNNLIYFPDEIIHSGALSKYRTGSGFCKPSMIHVPENDPNCRCVKGPLLREPLSDSVDQVFEPCPGEEGYIADY